MIIRILAAALFIVVLLQLAWWGHVPFWLEIVRWIVVVGLFVTSIRLYRQQAS